MTVKATEGIEAVFLETHNWGKAAKFFRSLGFELEFETDHGSGQLRNGAGAYVFIAEVPESQPLGLQVVLKVTDSSAFKAGENVEMASAWEETHYNTQAATVRDPDGRLWRLEAPK